MSIKVLIAGANSYIGDSFHDYLERFPGAYQTDILETKRLKPSPADFQGYDVVFCVTGVAHIKETAANRNLYYSVNRDLVVELAENAKKVGVKQFVLLSSMAVYGATVGHITKQTAPSPVTAYGKSKLQADEAIKKLEDDSFIFTCLRPPMVYGRNCRGNYQRLRKLALKFPLFPRYKNKRSMIYIDNLCEFIKVVIDKQKRGLFTPQNAEYVTTSEMVSLIAAANNKHIRFTSLFNWGISLGRKAGIGIVNKVFGDLTYEPEDTVDRYSFQESIELTENGNVL